MILALNSAFLPLLTGSLVDRDFARRNASVLLHLRVR